LERERRTGLESIPVLVHDPDMKGGWVWFLFMIPASAEDLTVSSPEELRGAG
jgi:hypothetical protein